MNISQRLREASGQSPTTIRSSPSAPTSNVPNEERKVDPIVRLKGRAHEALLGKLGASLYDASLSRQQLQAIAIEELDLVLATENASLTPAERQVLVQEITNDVFGYGPIEVFLNDPDVSEVMVNSVDKIFVERKGRLERTDAYFVTEDHLLQVIDRIVSSIGRRIDESSSMVDARLPDGSRVNAVIPPLTLDGPTLTIRKFSKEALGIKDLVGFGALTPIAATFLEACVTARMNMLVSGGTGTGKTTLLNVLSSFIPEDERVITIEDAAELQLSQEHVIRMESKPPNIEGRGAVTIRDLLKNCLRMRPDRIIVGECRGSEALDMLQAMNTGHEGSLSTLHANTPRDAVSRLETMVLMGGHELPLRAIRDQVASAVDVIVQLTRERDGRRHLTDITEVAGMEGDVITLNQIFGIPRTEDAGAGDSAKADLQPTGIRPTFTDRLIEAGFDLPAEVYMPNVGDLLGRPR